MSAADWENYRRNVLQPAWAKSCKEEAKDYATADGKLPLVVSNYCDCVARVSLTLLTREDIIYAEKNGKRPAGFESRVKTAVADQCKL
jgi:hypothetical protein